MIVRSNPSGDEDLDRADMAWFDSDAPSNARAISEIDAEAARHGLVRTREYWLQTFQHHGKVVFRGFCYRPEPSDELDRAERAAQRIAKEPVGISSVDLVRADRSE